MQSVVQVDVLSLSFFFFLQHVMKFAELTQEVLITKSEEVKSKFDVGMTPGRRRMHQEQLDKLEQLSE